MASPKIILKKSSVTSRVPSDSDLQYGELAINYADGLIYYKTSSNAIHKFLDSDNIAATYLQTANLSTAIDSHLGSTSIGMYHIYGTRGDNLWIGGDASEGAANISLPASTSPGQDLSIQNVQGSVNIYSNNAAFIFDSTGTLAANYFSGQYLGFDSDVTAAGLATEGFVNSAVTTGLNTIDSAYVQARQDYEYFSLTGAPTNLSDFVNDVNYLDSTTVQGVINSSYVNGLVDSVTNATNATKLNVATTTTNSAFYPTFVSASGANRDFFADGSLTFNPSTNVLTVGGGVVANITGNVTGNLTGNITSDSANLGGVTFQRTPTPYAGATPGTLYWDSDHQKGLSFIPGTNEGNNDVTINIGQESLIYVHNQTGETIYNGDVVYISGTAHGTHPSISKAQANAAVTGNLAVATMDIVNNAHGWVTRFGLVRDVNTAGLTAGADIYLSKDSAGKWTTTSISVDSGYPFHIGKVIRVDASTGSILVDPFTEHYEYLRIEDRLVVTGSVQASTILVDSSLKFTDIDYTLRPAWDEGRMWYDQDGGSIAFHTKDSDYIQYVGEREFVRGRNSSGALIPKGTPVYADGVHIAGHPIHGHHPLLYPADAAVSGKYEVIGITAHDIANGSHGYVLTRGWIQDIDTTALTSGERFHLAPGGGYQTSAPTYPNYPVDLGIAFTIDSAGGGGSIYVDINNHTQEQLRVTNNARVDGNLTVGGNLNVVGVTTTATTQNLTVSSNLVKLLEGNTLGTAYQSVGGLDDATFIGSYRGDSNLFYFVRINSVDSTGDIIEWGISDSDHMYYGSFNGTYGYGIGFDSNGGPSTWNLTSDGLTAPLRNNISIQFINETGHQNGDIWCAHPTELNLDLGMVGNYNEPGAGGIKYAGLYRSATDARWRFFDGLTQNLDGATVSISDSDGFTLSNVQANTFYGALSGNATSATTATQLATGRNFSITGDITASAVSFDGTGNVVLNAGITAGSIVNADINASAAIADTKLATISTAGKVQNSATTATSANTGSAIVARDASGNFSAGNITASLTGNASSADSSYHALYADSAANATNALTLGGNLPSYYLAASSYTASDVLTKIKTVDGAGSGLDADLLDGQSSTYFAAATHKSHQFTNGTYYYDNYDQSNYLRIFTENATSDTVRFGAISNVEYYDSSSTSWLSWTGGDTQVKNMLDGRQETYADIDHTHRKFRFTVTKNSGWPTQVITGIYMSWFGNGWTNIGYTIEDTTDNVNFTTKETLTFGSPNTYNDYGWHLYATSNLHNGRTLQRITIDITDWTDSGSYTTKRINKIAMFSNYASSTYSMVPISWNYDKVVSFAATPQVNSNNIWHAGNANLTSVDWSANNLTAQGNLTVNGATTTLNGGLVIEGSINSGGTAYGMYTPAGTNMVLKGNSSGLSGIFFQSEKDGTNINHTTDYGYIQFHPYGYGGTTGENNRLVIGVANDAADYVVLHSPYKNGVKISYLDATSGTGGSEYTVWHAGNDGAGSGLDADLLDGQEGTYYLAASSYTASDVLTKIKTVDGAGSGLDADTLDSYQPSTSATANTVALRDASGVLAAQWYTSSSNGAGTNYKVGDDAWIGDVNVANTLGIKGVQDGTKGYIAFGSTDYTAKLGRDGSGPLTWNSNTIWHAGNDGAGTGLDADLLDGQHGSYYATADSIDNKTDYINIPAGGFDFDSAIPARSTIYRVMWNTGNPSLVNSPNGNTAGFLFASQGSHDKWNAQMFVEQGSTGNMYIRGSSDAGGTRSWGSWRKIWHTGNDGAGTGLDADTLDGQQGTYYLNYNNLTNKPTNISTFVNDANYLDSTTVTGVINSSYVNGLVDSVSQATNALTLNSQSPSYYLNYNNLTNKPTIPVVGTDALAYDANLQSFVTAFTLPTSDGTSGQVLTTNGSGILSFTTVSGGGGSIDSAQVLAIVDSAYINGAVDSVTNATNALTLGGNSSSYYLAASTYTANDILTKIKTVDSNNSGLNASTLTGYSIGTSAGTIPLLNGANTWSGAQTFTGNINLNSSLNWQQSRNIVMTPTVNNSEWSFDFRDKGGYTGAYWHVWDSSKSSLLKVEADTGKVTAAYDMTVGGALTVTGNLTVNGTTTTVNSTTISVDDKNIELGSVNSPTDTTANGGGITLKGTTDKTIAWSSSTDNWEFNKGIGITGNIVVSGTVDGRDIATDGSKLDQLTVGAYVTKAGTSDVSSSFKLNSTDGFFEVRQNVSGWTASTIHPIIKWNYNGTYDDHLYLASGGNTAVNSQTVVAITEGKGVLIGLGDSAGVTTLSQQWVRFDNGALRMSGKIYFDSDGASSGPVLERNGTNLHVSNANGYIQFGPTNTSFAHIITDRSRFYFNKPLVVDGSGIGAISSYSTDLAFYTSTLTDERMRINASNGNVGIGTTTPGYKLEVNGSFAATTKSFVIPHPIQEGKKLRYGSLEGPENGVYVRGKTKENIIELPDYWTKLVDPESITVNLTPIGNHQNLFVEKIEDNKVYIKNSNMVNKSINCFYTVFAERCDVEKLEVEI